MQTIEIQAGHNLEHCLLMLKPYESNHVNFSKSATPGYSPSEFEIRWVGKSNFLITCYTPNSKGLYTQSSRCKVEIFGTPTKPIFSIKKQGGPYITFFLIFLILTLMFVVHFFSNGEILRIKENPQLIFGPLIILAFLGYFAFSGVEASPECQLIKRIISEEKIS